MLKTFLIIWYFWNKFYELREKRNFFAEHRGEGEAGWGAAKEARGV